MSESKILLSNELNWDYLDTFMFSFAASMWAGG